jgi:hypothetical protein
MFYKMGDVDDKGMLLKWMAQYDRAHGCKPFQVTPVTLSLADTATCLSFYSDNRRWAPSDTALWFIKESKGSQGTHITLWSSRHVQDRWRAQARMVAPRVCPDNASVASLAVRCSSDGNSTIDSRSDSAG